MQEAVSMPVTWTSVLNVANTLLIALVGFLFREAWRQIHNRVDTVEQEQGDMRERVASLEAARGWTHPQRRHGDRRQ